MATLQNFLLLGSSHSAGAEFPLCWGIWESGSQAEGSNALYYFPLCCGALLRAHGDSRIFALFALAIFLTLCFIACVGLSVLSSVSILSSVYY